MSASTIPCADQQQLDRLLIANKATAFADAKFFARRSDRQHRLRIASAAEVAMIQLWKTNSAFHVTVVERLKNKRDSEVRLRWYATVKRVHPGLCARVFSAGLPDLDCDLSEATCALVYVHVASSGGAELNDAGNCVVTLKGVRS